MPRNRLVIGLLLAAAGSAHAQTATLIIKEDDFIAPDIFLTAFDSVNVNTQGSWLVQARSATDSLLIQDGVVVGRQGESLADPPGGVTGFFGGARFNNNGNRGHRFSITGVPSNADSGIFFNQRLVIQEGDFSLAPQLASSSRYLGFFNATRMNDLDQIFVVATVDDPTIPSGVDRALVRVNYDAAVSLYTEDALAFETMTFDGAALVEIGTNPNQLSVSPTNHVMYFIDTDAATTEDGMLIVDQTVVAREGRPSPVPGFDFVNLSSRTHAVNNSGEWVARAQLAPASTTDDEHIFRSDGTVVAREGMAAPGLPGVLVTGFGTGPIWISSSGQVLWSAALDSSDDTNVALYVDDELLIREGDFVDGVTVTRVYNIQDSCAMSADGRYVIVRVDYIDPFSGLNFQGVMLFDRGEPGCPADLSGSSDPNDPAYGTPDGEVDLDDFFYFLDQFVAGNLAVADLTTASDPNDPGYGIPDGVLDISDFFYYLDRFVEGCP